MQVVDLLTFDGTDVELRECLEERLVEDPSFWSQFDSLCEGDVDERAFAGRALVLLQDHLDLADLEARRRAEWLFRGITPRDEAFLRLARRAVLETSGDLKVRAQLIEAQCLATAGDLREGVKLTSEAFEAVRGSGSLLEVTIAASLSQLLSIQNRDFESLILARAAEKTLGERTDATAEQECMVRIRICTALGALDATVSERLDAIARLEDAKSEYSGERRWIYDAWCLGARAELLAAEGDGAGAHEMLERLRTELPPQAARIWPPEHLAALESNIAVNLGHYEEALEQAERERDSNPTVNARGVLAAEHAFVLAKLGRAVEAREIAQTALEELVEPSVSAASALKACTRLAMIAAEALEDRELEKQALDRAAGAALHRIEEIAACAREFPELSSANNQELAEFRQRFATHHENLRERIVELLADDSELRKEIIGGDGLLVVCAWCLRALARDGAWMPVGHLFAPRAGVQITHGICPDCVGQIEA